VLAIGGLALLVPMDSASARDENDPRPTLREITAAVGRQFQSQPNRLPRDIISRSEVDETFELLRRMGWTVPRWKTISQRVPADTAFVVRQLRTSDGTKFMRRIAQYPFAYDRLDRLSGISGGRKLVADLVRKKGGYEMIEYLCKSRGGANLGHMLANAKNGSDLNRPTGKIYTVEQLLMALKKAYETEDAGSGPLTVTNDADDEEDDEEDEEDENQDDADEEENEDPEEDE
jgi:hypothetical protein